MGSTINDHHKQKIASSLVGLVGKTGLFLHIGTYYVNIIQSIQVHLLPSKQSDRVWIGGRFMTELQPLRPVGVTGPLDRIQLTWPLPGAGTVK